MKYVTEYRDPAKARALIEAIAKEAHADRQYRFMEFCGGHTHVLSRWGLLSILPPNV